jgi:hypothetical protein
MNLVPKHRSYIAWLALAAVLALALMPSLARAWVSTQAAQGGNWVELCTAEGTRWVKLSDEEPVQKFAMPDACDFCQLQGKLWVLLGAHPSWSWWPAVAAPPCPCWAGAASRACVGQRQLTRAACYRIDLIAARLLTLWRLWMPAIRPPEGLVTPDARTVDP